jgi:hypothetical protein
MPQFAALSNSVAALIQDHLVVEQFFSNERNHTASVLLLDGSALTWVGMPVK